MNTHIHKLIYCGIFLALFCLFFATDYVMRSTLSFLAVKKVTQLCRERNPRGSVETLARTYLYEKGVPDWQEIKIKRTQYISCSTDTCMWIEENALFGPQEFVIAHESAHIALGHFKARNQYELDAADLKEQEKEADLLACETLLKCGRAAVVFERLAHVTLAYNLKWREPDLDDHPTLHEIIIYLRVFLESVGYSRSVIDQFLAQRLPHLSREWGY